MCATHVRASVCDVSETLVVRAKYEPGPRHAPKPRMDRPADSRLFFASGAGRVTGTYLSASWRRESTARAKVHARHSATSPEERERFAKRGI